MSLLLVASLLASCSRTTAEGPLVYEGFPQSWVGSVAVGQPRAWGLIHFGKEGVQATVLSVSFSTSLPNGLGTRVDVNGGEPVPIGAVEGPEGDAVQHVPASISGVVQIVVWFEPERAGIEFFSGSTKIRYSIDDREYLALYPVGVGICSVERVTATTPCDVGPASSD